MIEQNKINYKSKFKLIFFISLLVVFFVLVKYTPLSNYANLETLKNSRNYLRSLSENWWSPILFVFIYIIGVISSFSGLVLTIAGALIFGTIKGTILNIIGSNIGANCAFLIGRYLGRDFVQKILKEKIKSLDNDISQNGFLNVLRLRLIPIVPFNLLNYALGLTSVRYKDYTLATFVGMAPLTFIYTFFADSLLIDPNKRKEAFINILIATFLVVLASFIPNLIKKKFKD